ncbi:MAG: S8 family serine peptidase [Prevotella sp.]|nr:S8 family serine peptidase [Prevotella sp.]
MKKNIVFICVLGYCLNVGAQVKMDIGSRMRLRAAKNQMELGTPRADKTATFKRRAKTAEQSASINAFVTLRSGDDVTILETAGATVRKVRGNIALAEFPAENLGTIEALGGVKRITLSRTLSPKLNLVREVSGIDKIHSGIDLPQAYTGAGVVAGIVDGGFDPNHINFQNPDGSSRIKRFTYYRPTQTGNYVEEIYDADYIPNIDTESVETFHGTHTLGILAGGYRGKVNVAQKKENMQGVDIKEMDNPYYGVAYGADIALAAGAFDDYHIALGIETILNYAYDNGQKPSVISLSLGSNVGPHDGSSIICQYLDEVSTIDKVVFCVSAGNEGDYPIALNKTFTEEDNTLKSCIFPAVEMPNYQNLRYGQTYVYSDSPEQFEIQAIVVNKSRGRVAMRMPMPATNGNSKYWVTSSDYAYDNTDVVSPQLAQYFEGYIGVGAEFDAETGRYYAVLDYMCWDNVSGSNADGNYIVGFEVTGSAGQRIDVFCDGVTTTLNDYGLAGYMTGSTDGTISDVACGNNYISVGSYNTRDEWASLDGYIYGYENRFPAGSISSFSSYGRLFDGRERPTVCAPGATVISSSNEYYLDAYRLGNGERQADLQANGRRYSWHQCVGTSMSTPLVAGAVALWLEADPDLKYDDVLDIIQKTAVKDADVLSASDPVQWGAGKFDAYEGLKEVLKRKSTGIVNVVDGSSANGGKLKFGQTGMRSFRAMLDGIVDFTALLYNVSGTLVGRYSSTNGEVNVDATGMPAGVYIIGVEGMPSANARILIR